MKRIAEAGKGAILYIEQSHGGIRVENRPEPTDGRPATLRSFVTPSKMDAKDYGIGAQILADLGLQKIILLSSKPKKVIALQGYGLEIVDQISLLED